MTSRPDLLHIIQGCVKAKRDSHKQFYELYYGYSMGICMRYCNNMDDAIEIVNDGFLKIFKALKSFSPQHSNLEGSLKGWMKRIMINTSIDFLRKNKRRFLIVEISDHHFNEADEVESAIDRMTYKEIVEIVQKLSPVYKTVFNLFVIDGYKHEEIAKKLRITVGTSKSNLAKARMNIKKMLQETGLNYYEQKVI